MRRIAAWARTLLTLHGSPDGIGLGFALGLSLSLFPIPFLGMIVALAVAPWLRANPAATYLGTAVVNPLTGAFFYFGELWVGAAVTGTPIPRWAQLATLSTRGWWDLLLALGAPFAIGVSICMAGAGLTSFALVRALVIGLRRRRSVSNGTSASD